MVDQQPELPMWLQKPMPESMFVEPVVATFITQIADKGDALWMWWRTANQMTAYALSLAGVEHMATVMANSLIEMHRIQAQQPNLILAEKQILGANGEPLR